MFNSVLVPVDGTNTSLRALKPAEAFAKASGAELVVATVLFADVIDLATREANMLERCADAGVRPDRAVMRTSSISVEDGLHTLMDKDTLVVIGSIGHSHTQKPFGNVSEDIIHHRPAGLSVVVGPKVKVDDYQLDGPVFGAVDPEAPSPELLDAVTRVSLELGLAPWLVSVVEDLKIPAGVGSYIDGDMPLESNHLHALAAEMEAKGTGTVNYEVLHESHTAREIKRYAEGQGASLIAVATRKRSGLSRLFFGSVAIDLVQKSTVPVLAVHTEEGPKE